jgi:hypothetical protein
MKRFDEPNSPAGSSEPSRDALESRIRELEAEVTLLHAKMNQMQLDFELDRQALEWYRAHGMPTSEVEMIERAKSGPSISDVIAEFDRGHANERR